MCDTKSGHSCCPCESCYLSAAIVHSCDGTFFTVHQSDPLVWCGQNDSKQATTGKYKAVIGNKPKEGVESWLAPAACIPLSLSRHAAAAVAHATTPAALGL